MKPGMQFSGFELHTVKTALRLRAEQLMRYRDQVTPEKDVLLGYTREIEEIERLMRRFEKEQP